MGMVNLPALVFQRMAGSTGHRPRRRLAVDALLFSGPSGRSCRRLPEEIYEAAYLDTSSGWDIFRYITLPLISPVLFTVTILRLVEAFKILDIPFSLTSGGPGAATQTLSFYIYLTGLRNFNQGYASAMAYILLTMVMIVSFFFFKTPAPKTTRFKVQHVYDKTAHDSVEYIDLDRYHHCRYLGGFPFLLGDHHLVQTAGRHPEQAFANSLVAISTHP